jgi:hypothetical protein
MSQVSFNDFRECVSALDGAASTIKKHHFRALSALSDEFHFRELAAQLA